MLQNRIPKFCFYFCSTEWNTELFSLPLNGSERNSKCLHLFFVPRNGIPSYFLFCGRWFRAGFQEFASIYVPRYEILRIFLLCRMVRNGIPRDFCSPEQLEFHRNKPIVNAYECISRMGLFIYALTSLWPWPSEKEERGCIMYITPIYTLLPLYSALLLPSSSIRV
jgi:hypothetical protein